MDFTVASDYRQAPKSEVLDGFKLIWYKVLLRAVYDYVLYKESKNKSLKRLAESAEKWLFNSFREEGKMTTSDGRTIRGTFVPFNSLENLCTLLDLDQEQIQKFARQLTRRDIRKIEFFQRNKYKPRTKAEKASE